MAGREWRDDFVFVKNARQHNSICCDGYIFGKYKGNIMRCRNRRCKGRIIVDNIDSPSRWSYVAPHSILHTQEMLEQYMSKRSRVEYIKQRDSRFVPRSLRISEVRRLDCHVSERAASRFVDRNTPKPQNPTSLQKIVLDDPSVRFLIDRSDNNNALIFGDVALVKKMAMTDILFMDGTFSSCCKLFAQLYIIHMNDGGMYRPVLFCFLPNKKQMTYEWLFNRVELLVKKQHETDVTVFDRNVVVKVDFEKAVIGALSRKRCRVSECFFHFAQCIYKNIRKKCWAEFKSDPEAKRLCSILVQMAFLTPPQIEAVSPLLEVKLTACGLGALWRYFSKTFLSRRFPPEMWSSQQISNRTNNRCESFHSALVKTFPVHAGKPSFGEVVNCINISLSKTPNESDPNPSRTSQLENENRFIERTLLKYADSLDATEIFTCLEKLSKRKTNLSIDISEIRSRVTHSSLEHLETDLEADPDEFDVSPTPSRQDETDENMIVIDWNSTSISARLDLAILPRTFPRKGQKADILSINEIWLFHM